MARQKRSRKITNPPHFKGFKPIGIEETSPVVLNFEEYEAIRLCDFELNDQTKAAELMEISRPTFTRIYEGARRKVAQAFVLGKAIVFEGGKVHIDSEWFQCNTCGCLFNSPFPNEKTSNCALCGSETIKPCDPEHQSSPK